MCKHEAKLERIISRCEDEIKYSLDGINNKLTRIEDVNWHTSRLITYRTVLKLARGL